MDDWYWKSFLLMKISFESCKCHCVSIGLEVGKRWSRSWKILRIERRNYFCCCCCFGASDECFLGFVWYDNSAWALNAKLSKQLYMNVVFSACCRTRDENNGAETVWACTQPALTNQRYWIQQYLSTETECLQERKEILKKKIMNSSIATITISHDCLFVCICVTYFWRHCLWPEGASLSSCRDNPGINDRWQFSNLPLTPSQSVFKKSSSKSQEKEAGSAVHNYADIYVSERKSMAKGNGEGYVGEGGNACRISLSSLPAPIFSSTSFPQSARSFRTRPQIDLRREHDIHREKARAAPAPSPFLRLTL